MSTHEANATAWNRIVAFVLAFVMVMGMIPSNIIVVNAAEEYGTVAALNQGGTVDTSDSVAVAVVYSGVTLEATAADSADSVWELGIKVTAPASMTNESDFVENSGPPQNRKAVTVQQLDPNGTWTDLGRFWNLKKSKSEDTVHYVELIGNMDVQSLITAAAAHTMLTYQWRFDWDMDGTYEQVVSMKIDPQTIVLKLNGEEVFPATLGYGVFAPLSEGAIQDNNTITYKNVTLNWVAKDASVGRNSDGWWLGVKMTAPASMLTEADFQNAVYQSSVADGWSENKSFWNAQDSDKNAESAERYLTMWGMVDVESLQAQLSEDGIATYRWRFDWNGDGIFEQVAVMNVDAASVVLMKDGVEQYPATKGYGVFAPLSEGAVQNDNTITYKNVILNWVAKDAAAGRNSDGWWLGVKMTAPASMLTEADFQNAVYQTATADGWSENKSFWNAQDSDKNAESAERYLTMWGMVDEDIIKAQQADDGVATYRWRFDWNGDGLFEQTAEMLIEVDSLILMKDGRQVWPKVYKTVSVSQEGQGTVQVNGKTVGNDESKSLEQYSDALIQVQAAEGYYISELSIGSEQIGTVKGTESYEKTVNLADNLTVSVVFTKKHTITFDGGNGSFYKVDGEVSLKTYEVAYGEVLTFTYSVGEGFELVQVKCGEETLTPVDGVYTITITGDTTITAETRDIKIPTIVGTKVSDSENWTRSKVVTLKVSDNVGVVRVRWSANADGSGAYDATLNEDGNKAEFTVIDHLGENSKAYTIWVYDAAGNVTTTTVEVKKIDRVAPKIGDVRSTEWFQSKTYFVKVEDSDSGVAKVWFTTDAEGKKNLNEAEYSEILGSYKFATNDKQATYYVFAEDNAGNRTSNVPGPDQENKDLNGPDIKLSENLNTDWTREAVMVDFTVKDSGSGVKSVYWYDQNLGETVEEEDLPENALLPLSATGTYSQSVESNGTYYIYAFDNSNNGKIFEVTISNIDTVEPVVVAEPMVGENIVTGWTNQDVKLVFTADDYNQSGVTKICCTESAPIDGVIPSDAVVFELEVTAVEGGLYTAEHIVTEESDSTYYYWAVDQVGNSSQSISSVTVQIDKTEPRSSTGVVYGGTHVSNGEYDVLFNKSPITFTLAVVDSTTDYVSGICAVYYKLNPLNPEEKESEWVNAWSDSEGVDALKFTYEIKIDGTFEGTIQYKVVDRAGNESLFDGTTQIAVDPTIPGEVQVSKIPEDWTSEDVTITVSGGNTIAGVDHYEYQVLPMEDDGTYPELTDEWVSMPTCSDENLQQRDGEGVIQDQLILTQQTAAKYRFRAVSNTGAVSEETDWHEVKIQKSAHEQALVTAFDQTIWYNAVPEIIIQANPENKANEAPVEIYWQLANTTKGEKLEDFESQEITDFGHRWFQDEQGEWVDGVYTLKVWSTNGFENLGTEYTIQLDASIPTVKAINLTSKQGTENILAAVVNAENSTTVATGFTKFYGMDALLDGKITISLEEDASICGTAKIEYQLVESLNDKSDANWKEYQGAIGVEANRKFFVCVRVTDNAGNVTEAVSQGVIVDDKTPSGNPTNVVPEIQITLPQVPSSGFYTGDINFSINAFDPLYSGSTADAENGDYSGLKSVTYKIYTKEADGSKVETERATMVATGQIKDANGLVYQWTQKNIAINSDKFDSNNVYIEVVAEDNAGNTRTTTFGPIKIDVKKPEIAVSYKNSSTNSGVYYQGKRTVTITVTERNFSAANTIVTVKKNGSAYPLELKWTELTGTGNGNNTKNVASYTFTEDGDYTFEITTKDLAGLSNDGVSYSGGNEQAFTIDNTDPTISVSYDNNTAVNDTYFAGKRVATITIVEHNFDSNLVKIDLGASLDGVAITKPVVSRWSNGSGDRHTATIVYEADGDYTFDIHVTDLAQNADNGTNYGGSKAPKAFTVDTTIVEPDISGVEDGGAYKEEVKPEVTVTDENFAEYTVQLLRTRLGEKNVDVTKDFFNLIVLGDEGGSLLTEDFPHEPEYDGIYTLTVAMTDKAGNTSSKTTVFTVNRFGSVYVFEDYLAGLVADGGDYTVAVTEDLVLTEYNADKLIENSARVVITRDGQPVDEVIFEVTPEVTSKVTIGESGWYQYLYTISADNFAEDGIYEISISSRDETGNNPGNANYADKIIRFRVDSTAPEISIITGLEEGIVNAPELEVGFVVYDTIGLESVTIYVDGEVYGDVITDFGGDKNNYEGSFVLKEADSAQHVRIVVKDLSGNIIDTDADNFTSEYEFHDRVTVSTNWFVRWFANKPLFFGSLIGGAGLLALLWFLIFGKRKKEEEEQIAQ